MTPAKYLDTLAFTQNFGVELLVVSKGRSVSDILPILNAGHCLFGENRVQESMEKWVKLKHIYPDVKLHLIGHLQTNKVKEAVQLFDCIQSVDSLKLANLLYKETQKQARNLTYFLQVNISSQTQQYGIKPDEISEFLAKSPIKFEGLMCILPQVQNLDTFCYKMQELSAFYGFKKLSMGMSSDFKEAMKYGSTLVRIGSILFE